MTTAQIDEKEVVEHIDIVGIDPNSFDDVESSPEAVRFAVVLNEEPSEGWNTVFHTIYGRVATAVHPPIEVSGSRLLIDYLPRYESELGSFFNLLRSVVAMANDEMVKSAEIAAGITADERKARFREALLRLKW